MTRTLRLAAPVLALLLAAPAAAQKVTGKVEPGGNRRNITLSGVARIGGAPFSGLTVSLSSPTGEGAGGQAETGADGGFRMTGLTPGTYDLLLRTQKHKPMMLLYKQVEVTADQEIAVDFVTGRLQGRVVTPDGKPVADVRIFLEGKHSGWFVQVFADSDGQGRFDLRIPSGEYSDQTPRSPETRVQVPAGGVATLQIRVPSE